MPAPQPEMTMPAVGGGGLVLFFVTVVNEEGRTNEVVHVGSC